MPDATAVERDRYKAALERFADRDNWAEPAVHTCGCRFTEWCDQEDDPHPADIARAALSSTQGAQDAQD